jgi:hypothetical protein
MPAVPPQGKRGLAHRRQGEMQAGLHFLTRQLSFWAVTPLILSLARAPVREDEKGS